ncbi:MAG: SDR family oxidoreductase [Chloroflexota bacterium]
MKVLIIGASGMLGQTLFQLARQQPDLDVYGTVRRRDARVLEFLRTPEERIFECDLEGTIDPSLYCSPDVVINCAGIIKQQGAAQADLAYIRVNALAPYILADLCERQGARLIQLSTDCVFSGRVGQYSEADIPDPVELYDRSKLLGEVTRAPHLTVRTSFIGFERFHNQALSLLDWFLCQTGEIKGYTRAIWSGLTTLEVARNLILLARRPEVTGLLHLCGEKISKYELLVLAREIFNRSDVVIHPYDGYVCDRSLVSTRLSELGISVPGIRQMLIELCEMK